MNYVQEYNSPNYDNDILFLSSINGDMFFTYIEENNQYDIINDMLEYYEYNENVSYLITNGNFINKQEESYFHSQYT